MAYIGNQPAESFTSFATQEFSTSATTSYTLDHAVANENEIALFVNNVRQQPGSGKAYTATGTALTLSAATASTDTMYCIFLGRALQTVTPATNSITAAMVGNDLISGKDALTSSPDDTDELLISDAGTLKRIDVSLVGGKNTPSFSVTQGSAQDISNATATKLAFNTEVFDTDSAFDHSSNYRFTVPSGKGGKYFFYAQATLQATQDADANSIIIYKNGSQFQTAMNTNQYYDTSEISIVMDLSAGDYIEIYYEHNRGTTDDVGGGRWYGFKLIT